MNVALRNKIFSTICSPFMNSPQMTLYYYYKTFASTFMK